MNGGESPLASKLKASDISTPEQFAHFTQSGAGVNDGGAAPGFGPTAAAISTEVAEADSSGVAKSGGIMRPRS
jgi:hypothetical protein